jgi:hypothetical protein
MQCTFWMLCLVVQAGLAIGDWRVFHGMAKPQMNVYVICILSFGRCGASTYGTMSATGAVLFERRRLTLSNSNSKVTWYGGCCVLVLVRCLSTLVLALRLACMHSSRSKYRITKFVISTACGRMQCWYQRAPCCCVSACGMCQIVRAVPLRSVRALVLPLQICAAYTLGMHDRLLLAAVSPSLLLIATYCPDMATCTVDHIGLPAPLAQLGSHPAVLRARVGAALLWRTGVMHILEHICVPATHASQMPSASSGYLC